MIAIRPIRPGEGAQLHSVVHALSDPQEFLDHLAPSPDMNETAMFTEHSIEGALFAEFDGVAAGCAVWYQFFFTFRAFAGRK